MQLCSLFQIITRNDYPENEYLMKCVMRVIVSAGHAGVDISNSTQQCITVLAQILVRVIDKFQHITCSNFYETIWKKISNINNRSSTDNVNKNNDKTIDYIIYVCSFPQKQLNHQHPLMIIVMTRCSD